MHCIKLQEHQIKLPDCLSNYNMWCKVTRRHVWIVLGVYNVEVTVSGMEQLQSSTPLNEALQYNYGIKQHVAVPCRNQRLFYRVFRSCIAAFEAPYCWTSVKGWAHTCFVDAWISNKSTKRIWAPPLTEVQWYGASKAAMWSKYTTEYFDFYTGLLHVYSCIKLTMNINQLTRFADRLQKCDIHWLQSLSAPPEKQFTFSESQLLFYDKLLVIIFDHRIRWQSTFQTHLWGDYS